jgi:hypothetical protein
MGYGEMTEFDTRPPQYQPAHVVIESLRQQLAECQAQNAKLAERVVGVGEIAINSVSRQALAECQAKIECFEPVEFNALKRQWQREALLEAAQKLEALDGDRDFEGHWAGEHLRRMADL